MTRIPPLWPFVLALAVSACQSDGAPSAGAETSCTPTLGSHLCSAGDGSPVGGDLSDPALTPEAAPGRGGGGH